MTDKHDPPAKMGKAEGWCTMEKRAYELCITQCASVVAS
jgi:hypothetical protein